MNAIAVNESHAKTFGGQFANHAFPMMVAAGVSQQ
jgi:hypothetical protein